MMKLYSYWRSSTSYRVRLALNLKQLPYDIIPVHLLRDGGEQHAPAFVAKNPGRGVPVLEDGTFVLAQSLAIIEYLEEKYPEPTLLPGTAEQRARHRQIAQLVACDIHPLANLRTGQYLKTRLGHSDEQVLHWNRHWIRHGLEVAETLLCTTGPYALGPQPGLADICLIPQVYSAIKRFGLDLTGCPKLLRCYESCEMLSAFAKAFPAAQPDAER